MVSKQLKKARKKGRQNRVTIDDKYVGPEPYWDETNPTPTEDRARQRAWSEGAHWYNYFYKNKDYVPYIIRYAKEVHNFDQKQIDALKELPDWQLCEGTRGIARLHFRGWDHEEELHQRALNSLNDHVITGTEILKNKKEIKKTTTPPPTPAQRAYKNMIETVYTDWAEMVVDNWLEGKYNLEFNVYELWKKHGLKGNIINAFREKIQFEYDCISDAYNNKCDQAVEAYSHITRRRQKKMLNLMDTVFSDLAKLKDSFKAVRMPRAKKPKSTDAQVANLQYLQEDIDSKVTSINPILIPTKELLWVYNIKQRVLTQYTSTATKGFEVGGTTIKNFDPTLSKRSRLRKPQDILPDVLKLTPKQIEKRIWGKLTTKINSPTGRINKDCILLRAI